MKLYKITTGTNYVNFFGTGDISGGIERDATIIAQTPSCDAFLFLSNTTYEDHVELLDAVPSGYDFTYCQEWGLDVNQTVLDRVIEDLG